MLSGIHTSVASTVSLVISTLLTLKGRKIRWGAYGDPAMISPSLVALLNEHAAGHTGYTHQWSQPWAQWCKGVFQASCDSFAQYLDASAHGWKTFAVVAKGKQSFSGKLCPATADNKTDIFIELTVLECITCSLCDGASNDYMSLTIFVEDAHGSGAYPYVINGRMSADHSSSLSCGADSNN